MDRGYRVRSFLQPRLDRLLTSIFGQAKPLTASGAERLSLGYFLTPYQRRELSRARHAEAAQGRGVGQGLRYLQPNNALLKRLSALVPLVATVAESQGGGDSFLGRRAAENLGHLEPQQWAELLTEATFFIRRSSVSLQSARPIGHVCLVSLRLALATVALCCMFPFCCGRSLGSGGSRSRASTTSRSTPARCSSSRKSRPCVEHALFRAEVTTTRHPAASCTRRSSPTSTASGRCSGWTPEGVTSAAAWWAVKRGGRDSVKRPCSRELPHS